MKELIRELSTKTLQFFNNLLAGFYAWISRADIDRRNILYVLLILMIVSAFVILGNVSMPDWVTVSIVMVLGSVCSFVLGYVMHIYHRRRMDKRAQAEKDQLQDDIDNAGSC